MNSLRMRLTFLISGWFFVCGYAQETGLPVELQNASDSLIVKLFDGSAGPPHGAQLWLILIVIALSTLVTEDLTCVVTGLMIANDNLSWMQGLSACLCGILLGDFMLYYAGRRLGRPVLRRMPLRWMIDPVKLEETEEWFSRRGGAALLISRFIPGTRLAAFVCAGLMGMPYLKFIPVFGIAALIWTPTVLWLSVKLADQAIEIFSQYQHAVPLVLLSLFGVYVLIQHLLIPAGSWRGRRQLAGRWRRLTRPEYWPASLLYGPVFFDLALRWLRPGENPFDFTACNPCMPGSGVVGESKSRILDQLGDRSAVAAYAKLSLRLSPAERLVALQSFMTAQGISYPVVLKPDAGERGHGVVIAQSEAQAAELLTQMCEDYLVQVFISGTEYGVFYVREPADEKGRVFAITCKTFCQVTGDGIHKLEDLILKDPRAVAQADLHLLNLKERLFEIPPAGEVIQLTDVGNHARGTLFENGMDLLTSELQTRLDEISQSMPGFYFGRYDLIAPDQAAFRQGRDLKVIELNGVTSEATSIYDPRNGYLQMVKTLIAQWRIASEIGRALQQQGAIRLKPKDLIRMYDRHLQKGHRFRLRKKRLTL